MDHVSGELWAVSYRIKEVTWEIPNFFDLPFEEGGFYVESPEFLFANGAWCLRLLPNGEEANVSTPHMNIMLLRLCSDVREHRICCKVGLLTRDGEEYGSSERDGCFEGVKGSKGLLFYLLRSKVVKERRRLEHRDGAVMAFCEMRVEEAASVETSAQTEPSHFEVGESSSPSELSAHKEELRGESPGVRKLQSDYNTLLQSGEDSDVLLVVSGKEFRAHRCILGARSAVFSAMFKHETEERESGKVVIDDLDPDSFPDFLHHLYTGRVETFSDENVFSLYSAADKYDAQELMSECREFMQRTLSVDTFCDVMILALRYREKELLTLAIDFFSRNLDKIIVTSKWLMFMRDNYVEANELLVKALVSGGEKTGS